MAKLQVVPRAGRKGTIKADARDVKSRRKRSSSEYIVEPQRYRTRSQHYVATRGLRCWLKKSLTAVWALMWVQPTIFALSRGLSASARLRSAMMPGISAIGGEIVY